MSSDGPQRLLVGLAILVTGLSSPALAAEDPDQGWGISIWGLSYHIDDEIDFDEANVGLGLRYYFNRLVFAEVDALRNSNGGLAVPVSAGLDLKVASLGQACNLYAVAAGAVVYYQNSRTEREYFRGGTRSRRDAGLRAGEDERDYRSQAVAPAGLRHRGVAHNPVAVRCDSLPLGRAEDDGRAAEILPYDLAISPHQRLSEQPSAPGIVEAELREAGFEIVGRDDAFTKFTGRTILGGFWLIRARRPVVPIAR